MSEKKVEKEPELLKKNATRVEEGAIGEEIGGGKRESTEREDLRRGIHERKNEGKGTHRGKEGARL